MHNLRQSAFAKLNLTLDVLDKRPDGFHDLRSVMQTVSLHDDVVIDLGVEEKSSIHCYRQIFSGTQEDHADEVLLETDGLPQDEDNLAWKAAALFYERTGIRPENFEIFINKRIPVQAGLGGGSADAAAVLRALDQHYEMPLSVPALCELGSLIGSDVPFCVMGGTVLVEGRGELLTRLPDSRDLYFVICKPDFSLSTAELYQKLDESFIEKRPDHKALMSNLQQKNYLGIGGSFCNVFDPIVLAEHFEINYIRSMMFTYGAYGVQMSGSGPAMFGLYDSFEYATVACTMLRDRYAQVYLATSV